MKPQSIHSVLDRISFLYLLVAVSVASASSETKNATETGGVRIIGGRKISIDKAPFMVQIKDNFGNFICGGTLVSDRFVVTAAHCFNGHSQKTIQVFAGATLVNGDKSKVMRKAENFWLPPEYKLGSLHMDAAVIKLRKPFKISKTTRSIKMCKTLPQAGEELKVSGWGVSSRSGLSLADHSNELRQIVVKVVSQDECIQRHKNTEMKITESMMCASVPGVKDACKGDSGGPALYQGRLCGIVSWGKGCARADYPGVYTSIPAVQKFIEECLTN